MLYAQVALEKSQGNVGAAIEALRKYVDVFQTDRDAWEELGALYVQARLACLAFAWYQGPGINCIPSCAGRGQGHVHVLDGARRVGGAGRAVRADVPQYLLPGLKSRVYSKDTCVMQGDHAHRRWAPCVLYQAPPPFADEAASQVQCGS